MNRWLPAQAFDAAVETSAAQLPVTAANDARAGLIGLWELARRFSGVLSIAVLGAAMLLLAFRAEERPDSAQGFTPAALPAQAAEPERTAYAIPLRSAAYAGAPDPAIIYYLFATEDQRQIVLLAESVAGQEGAAEIAGSQRQFYALDAGTPESEQAARDTIFEAMLTNDGRTRVIVNDLR